MENIIFFKWLAIFSPVLSGIIGGILTHYLSNRSKRLEILYQHKIPAFKEIHKVLVNYKSFLEGKVQVSEFLENKQKATSIFTVNALNNLFEINGVYFNKNSRNLIISLIGDIHNMCNFEVLVHHDEFKNSQLPYQQTIDKIEGVIEQLYKELNLN